MLCNAKLAILLKDDMALRAYEATAMHKLKLHYICIPTCDPSLHIKQTGIIHMYALYNLSGKKGNSQTIHNGNAKSQQILTELCAADAEYVCEKKPTKFDSKILLNSRVINLQTSMTKYLDF